VAVVHYQDLDTTGARLNGADRYTVTANPPVNGFWSLTLYNEHHFAPNAIKRYSVGTKSKNLRTNPDGCDDLCASGRAK
jgi:hypothetical protein